MAQFLKATKLKDLFEVREMRGTTPWEFSLSHSFEMYKISQCVNKFVTMEDFSNISVGHEWSAYYFRRQSLFLEFFQLTVPVAKHIERFLCLGTMPSLTLQIGHLFVLNARPSVGKIFVSHLKQEF